MVDITIHTLAWLILVFTLIRLGVSLANYLSPLYMNGMQAVETKLVSILIPARNEAHNLPPLLDALLGQTYENFELIVYDDHSDDGTSEILQEYPLKDSRMNWIRGGTLPEGWNGKNHACHQLAGEAKGELFLFLDADVMVSSDLLEKAVARQERDNLSLLSVFPHQIMKSRGEWLTVPLMNWILLSLLPMALVRKSPRPSFAAANGQFMMFRAEDYNKYRWHEQVRESLVEDIEISRMVKQKGLTTATLLGNDDVMCRMYGSFNEGIHGFAKNVTEFFGGSLFTTLAFLVVTISGVVLIPYALGWGWFTVYLFSILLIRVLISAASRQSIRKNLMYHFPQMIAFVFIVVKGIQVKKRGRYQWKGRYAVQS